MKTVAEGGVHNVSEMHARLRGLCLWRLGRFDEAERVFDRMPWLNPLDNQGVRFLIDDVRTGTAWEERESEW
jgi:pentatricopeptide repeat protein